MQNKNFVSYEFFYKKKYFQFFASKFNEKKDQLQ